MRLAFPCPAPFDEPVFGPARGLNQSRRIDAASRHRIAAAQCKLPLAMFSELVSTKQMY
jgi:hypothetical protein